MQTFELIEIDPATGEEDQLINTGSFEKMHQNMLEMLEEVSWSMDEGEDTTWPWLMIQPAK